MGNLQYAGKVRTGFKNALLRKWRKQFDKIIKKSNQFMNVGKSKTDGIYWIKLQNVGQFGFTKWTKPNKLRHSRFLGTHNAKEIVKE